MDRSKRDARTAGQAAAPGTEGGKVLKFTPRLPKPAFTDYGSGWYHQAAIDGADQGGSNQR
jgi:hypothetical protein